MIASASLQERFTTGRDWFSAAYDHHFKDRGLARRQPFFIIRRELLRHAGPAYTTLKTSRYVGIRSDKKPSIRFIDYGSEKSGLLVEAQRYVRLSEGDRGEIVPSVERGPLVFIHSLALDRTPITRSFPASPWFADLGEVEAFSVAVGTARMERLCLMERDHKAQLVDDQYVDAVYALGIPITSPEMKLGLVEVKKSILTKLLECRANLRNPRGCHRADEVFKEIWHNLRRAKALRMHGEIATCTVEGIRYRPAELLQDFEELYPEPNK